MNRPNHLTRLTKPTLRSRVLRHVLLPLALLWLAGSGTSLLIANYFAGQGFDRSLLDDAYSVAANVRESNGRLELQLTPREVTAVLFDQVEKVYFSVRRADGALIGGEAGLPQAELPPDSVYVFSDVKYAGRSLRAVTLRQELPEPFFVVMSQTTRARTSLLRRLLMYSIAPEIIFLLLLAGWLWRAIEKDLHPIEQLRGAVEARGTNDLTPVSVDASTRDVERLMNAINSMLERIGFGVATHKEFVGNVAHELRTPLAGIRALADYGLGHKDPAVWREQLARISQSQRRASHLFDQLLALALAGEAEGTLELVPVRLDELATRVLLRHLGQADQMHVDLGAVGLTEEVWVDGDVALLEGMLDNLIDNSLKYGRRTDGRPGSITVEIHRDQDGVHHAVRSVMLSVIDDGPGIATEAQQQLLRRWAQGPDGQSLGHGAGLGLSIVARYAAILNATLALAPGPDGVGLCVRIIFASETAPSEQTRALSSSPDSR